MNNEKTEINYDKNPNEKMENIEEDKKLIKENEQQINENEIKNEIKEDDKKIEDKIKENVDEEKNEKIIKNIDYNNIYFIIKRKKEKNLSFTLDKEDPQIIMNNIKTIKMQNNNEEEIIEIINIKIESEKISEEKLQIFIINNETNNKDKLIISSKKDIKELYNYIPYYDYKGKELLKISLEEQFDIYSEFFKKIPNNENELENFIKSTIYYLKNNEYSFEFYISFFLKFHQFYAEEILELFDKNKIIANQQDIKEEIKDKIIDLSKNPKVIGIKDVSKKNKSIQIFYEIILYYYIHFQIDKIKCLLENENNIYYENFNQYIPKCLNNEKQFSKKIILNLLSVAKNMTEVHNILLLAEKNIKNIPNILDIIIDKEQKIYELYKKEKRKINLIDYVEINENDDINLLLKHIEKLSKQVLEFLDISDVILEDYINFNKEKLDNLYTLNKIINILNKNINLSEDINKIIISALIQLKTENLDCFVKIIEENNNDNNRLLDMLTKFFKKEFENIEYLRQPNNILNKLKTELNQVNICNYDKSEKYIKNEKLMNFLYVKEDEKNKAIENIKKKIQKYKSYTFFLNYIFFPLLIFIIIIPFLFSKINFEISNYNLIEINWDIFNKSKELAQNESNKYPFEQIFNIDYKENKDKYNQQEILNNTIIIGIDLGAINTGYSYTIKSINDDNKNIKINNEKKYPNEIEISRNEKKGLKYALRASVSLVNYGFDELNNINFIKGIKNLIYMDKYNNDNLCYFYPNEYVNEINITNVIKEYLLMIKNDILKKLKEEEININKIKWILSVPQSWHEFEKQIILNSAIESGLSDISFIYESESAALSLYLDKSLPNDFIKRKKNIILIDIGGINTQLSIYELNKDYISEKIEIKNNTVKNTGFLIIVEKMINVLEKALGKKNILKIKKEEPGSWIRILKDIHKAVENTYKLNGIEIFDIYTPFSYRGEYKYKYKFQNEIKKYIIKYDSYNLIFPAELVGNFIFESVNNILNHTNNIINEMKSRRILINNIIITGGFSRNKIFQNEIKNYFIENSYMHIYSLSSYDNAISKGEVYYGLNNSKINNRFCTETIGIKLENEIQILLKKGENMNNYFTKTIFIKPTNRNKNLIQINIYTSNTNEILSESDFMGRLMIPLDDKINDVIMVKIKYDIVLTFKAYNKNNGEEIKTKFEYFK